MLIKLFALALLWGCAQSQKVVTSDGKGGAHVEDTPVALGVDLIPAMGKDGVLMFVRLARRAENAGLVRFPPGPPHTKVLHPGGPAMFWFNSSPESYMVYEDDLNNDGYPDYVVVILDMGSGEHGGVYGAYFVKDKQLVSLAFEKAVAQSLAPSKDAPHVGLYLAKPFAFRKAGKQYLRFLTSIGGEQSVHTYLWQGDRFQRVNVAYQ